VGLFFFFFGGFPLVFCFAPFFCLLFGGGGGSDGLGRSGDAAAVLSHDRECAGELSCSVAPETMRLPARDDDGEGGGAGRVQSRRQDFAYHSAIAVHGGRPHAAMAEEAGCPARHRRFRRRRGGGAAQSLCAAAHPPDRAGMGDSVRCAPWADPFRHDFTSGKPRGRVGLEHDPEKACLGTDPRVGTGFRRDHASA